MLDKQCKHTTSSSIDVPKQGFICIGPMPEGCVLPLKFMVKFTRQLHSRISIWFELHQKILCRSLCITCMGSKVWLRWLSVNLNVKLHLTSPRSTLEEGTYPPLTPTPLGYQGGPLVQLSSRLPFKIWAR